jgi:hypothetical protein
MELDAIFSTADEGGRFVASDLARGPWDPVAVAESTLYDGSGRVARAVQALVVSRR